MGALQEGDLFTSGDFAPVGFIAYRALFFNTEWMLLAVMEALTLMCDAENWNTVGSLSPTDCADLAIQMVEEFSPMVKTVGVIYPFAGDTLPDGALWCDGSSYLRSAYPELFDTIGTAFGAADGTHFNVPDLRARVPVGAGTSSGYDDHSVGDEFGQQDVTLTVFEMPSHSHADIGHAHGYVPAAPSVTSISPGVPEPTAVPGIASTSAGFANLANTGNDGAHYNVQPSLAVNYIICTL